MKKFTFFVFLLLAFQTKAQVSQFASFGQMFNMDSTNSLAAKVGLTTIGGETFIGLRLQPEIAFGKWAVGMSLPVMFSLKNFSFRNEEYKQGSGGFRLFNYIRYGVKKRDDIYFKWGSISGERIGFGSLINNYTNSSSFERRKVGLSYDVLLFKMFGVEGFYSDIESSSLNLFAIRPYFKPFGKTETPLLKSLEIGLTYIKDKDATLTQLNDSTRVQNVFATQGDMSAWGLDIGMNVVNSQMLQIQGFMQYSQLGKNESDSLNKYLGNLSSLSLKDFASGYKSGSGFSLGVNLKLNLIAQLLTLDARLERQFYSNYYLPQFFDAVYEINKDQKIASLATAQSKQGTYGTVAATILNKITIGGGLLLPDSPSETQPALVQLSLDGSKLMDKLILRGSYLRGGITDLSDAFKFDERSLASLDAAYQIKPYLSVGLTYLWTYAKAENGSFKAASYMSPYFNFSLPIFGDKK